MIAGGILGVVIGGIFSLPFLSGYSEANSFLLHKMLKLLTVVGHIEMDSVAAIHDILAHTEHLPKISSTNTVDDTVIPPKAALNTGLQFGLDSAQSPLKMSFFWYGAGGHNGEPQYLYQSQKYTL